MFMLETMVRCGDFATDIPAKVPDLVHTIYTVILIAVPVLLIIFGMLDLGKAVIAQKEDEIKKGQQIFVKRIIAAVIVFLVMVVVQLVIGLLAPADKKNIMNCVDCFINGSKSCTVVE